MDGTEYIVLLHTRVQTEEYNITVDSEKLIGTKKHLTLQTSCHLKQCHYDLV
jgi:hypothetical protein